MQARARYEPWDRMVAVQVYQGGENGGKYHVAVPDPDHLGQFNWVEHDPWSGSAGDAPITFRLPEEMAGLIITAVSAQIKPPTLPVTSDTVDAAQYFAELSATRSHLEDMRRLALRGIPPLVEGSVNVEGVVNVGGKAGDA